LLLVLAVAQVLSLPMEDVPVSAVDAKVPENVLAVDAEKAEPVKVMKLPEASDVDATVRVNEAKSLVDVSRTAAAAIEKSAESPVVGQPARSVEAVPVAADAVPAKALADAVVPVMVVEPATIASVKADAPAKVEEVSAVSRSAVAETAKPAEVLSKSLEETPAVAESALPAKSVIEAVTPAKVVAEPAVVVPETAAAAAVAAVSEIAPAKVEEQPIRVAVAEGIPASLPVKDVTAATESPVSRTQVLSSVEPDLKLADCSTALAGEKDSVTGAASLVA